MHVDHHGGPVRLPAILVLAHQLNRGLVCREDGARQQRGIERGIISAVVPVTPGAIRVDYADGLGWQVKDLGDGTAGPGDRLR